MNGQGKEIVNMNQLPLQHIGEGNTTWSAWFHKPHISELKGKPTAIAPEETRDVTPHVWHKGICEEKTLIFS